MLMLLILLSLAWLGVAVMVLAVCWAAARGDSDLAKAHHGSPPPNPWDAVRDRILTSSRGDRFATHR
jgi:hypothetical protein